MGGGEQQAEMGGSAESNQNGELGGFTKIKTHTHQQQQGVDRWLLCRLPRNAESEQVTGSFRWRTAGWDLWSCPYDLRWKCHMLQIFAWITIK